jgi:hypothetical protein
MEIGEIFRYARPYSAKYEVIDDLPNYFWQTFTPGEKFPLLESGINPIQKIGASGSQRCPAILISSSPHKIGSEETPWQDFFDPDNGYIRYFGDNKKPGVDPGSPLGNKALLEQFELHSSLDKSMRAKACPILFFKRVRVGKRVKGNVQFNGFGIINGVERITQYDRKNQRTFPNYVFEFTVFSLGSENELFNWDWISSRRNIQSNDITSLKNAPESWKLWVQKGPQALEACRRRVVKLFTYSSEEQKPIKGSREEKVLEEIYSFYTGRKSRFESLAAIITSRIIQKNGHTYYPGWITPASSDHGADFIGRLDIGTDLARAKVIVLGQAKCEKISSPTGGNHIARTVARLRRGWIGVYVTTSYFSVPVQREVLQDKYPILLVNGLRLTKEAIELAHEQGFASIQEFLESIDINHDARVKNRDPEEILFE